MFLPMHANIYVAIRRVELESVHAKMTGDQTTGEWGAIY
jgi:hypothetical protein